ncbi:MAG: hypothetical protein U1D30_06520 [Planctomycetota bacterium]
MQIRKSMFALTALGLLGWSNRSDAQVVVPVTSFYTPAVSYYAPVATGVEVAPSVSFYTAPVATSFYVAPTVSTFTAPMVPATSFYVPAATVPTSYYVPATSFFYTF